MGHKCIDMKKITLIVFVLSIGAFLSSYRSVSDVDRQQNGTVFICTGGYSTKYHSYSNCSGLNNCQANIVAISLDKAKDMGRTPCQRCY